MSSTVNGAKKKADKKAEEKRLSAQKSIPYREMARDGICRVQDKYYSKTIRFYDINYQLAQNEDKNAILKTGVISSITLTAVSISSCRSSTTTAT